MPLEPEEVVVPETVPAGLADPSVLLELDDDVVPELEVELVVTPVAAAVLAEVEVVVLMSPASENSTLAPGDDLASWAITAEVELLGLLFAASNRV